MHNNGGPRVWGLHFFSPEPERQEFGDKEMISSLSCSLICGIRQEAMDLIGDCHRKGATRIIEDLEHADCTQHPRNLLPGLVIPMLVL